MPQARDIEVQFPLAGLDRRHAYQVQPPYTTPEALNVRPEGTLERRMRGGSRPGVRIAERDGDGDMVGYPIRLLTSVQYNQETGSAVWEDEFTGTTAAVQWDTGETWGDGAPTHYDDLQMVGVPYTNGTAAKGYVSEAFAGGVAGNYKTGTGDINEVSIYIAPYKGRHCGTYYLYMFLDDTTPDPDTAGVFVSFTITTSGATTSYSGTLTYRDGSTVETDTFSGSQSHADGGRLVLRQAVTDTLFVVWRGTVLSGIDSGAISLSGTDWDNFGSRVGFKAVCTLTNGRCLIDWFRHFYYSDDVDSVRRVDRLLVASANGKMFYEYPTGDFVEKASATVRSDIQLAAAEHAGRLFLPNCIAEKAGSLSAKLFRTSSGYYVDATFGVTVATSDFCCIRGIETDRARFGDVPSQDILGYFTIGAVTGNPATQIRLDSMTADLTVVSGAPAAANCVVSIPAVQKVFSIDGTFDSWVASTGIVPAQCPLACRYRDRIVLAGDPPQLWYMSRSGDPFDFDFTADDEDQGRAVAGVLSTAGGMYDAVTALIPGGDDYLILGCKNSIWIMLGDLAAGGQMDNLTSADGIVGQNAWCRTADRRIIVLGNDGLYQLSVSPLGVVPLTQERLPAEMRNIDTSIFTPSLVYDPRGNGVMIWLSGTASAIGRQHWWYDLSAGGFWPVETHKDCEPIAVETRYGKFPSDRGAVWGTRVGTVLTFDPLCNTDNGNAFSSYCLYGPFRGADRPTNVSVDEIQATLPESSGRIKWELLAGESAEVARSATAATSGYFNAGRNLMVRPRRSGASFYMKLGHDDASGAWRQWSIDALNMRVRRRGPARLQA